MSERKLLFMAGMWQQNQERFDHVIERRGLGVLLRAGELLSSRGVSLTVAAPIFESDELTSALMKHRLNSWPSDSLRVLGIVDDVPSLFLDHTIMVFPYQHDIQVFRPTSVMEAMTLGTVPVVSDLPFLRTSLGDADAALWFRHDDPESLAEVILGAFDDPSQLERLSKRAMAHAGDRWSITATGEALVAALG